MISTNPYSQLSETDHTKAKNITSAHYFDELVNNLPDNLARRIPFKFAYIWSKSAMILTMGNEIYRKRDHFKYPLPEWDSEDFDNGLKQIVHQLKGFSPLHYIDINEPVNSFNLLDTFHFKPIWYDTMINDDDEQLLWIKAIHRLDNDEINLYFKF